MIICLSMLSLYADWNPEQVGCHPKLTDNSYVRLKEQVAKELVNSWCSREKVDLLMDLILMIEPKICVEIGACTGSSVLPIAATLKYLQSGKVFAIDAWSNSIAVRYLTDEDPNKKWWSHVDMQAIYKSFKSLIKRWSLKDYCSAIPLPSEEALQFIPAEIDFLHLDGDYSQQGSLQDVELYLPKVKSGGYILLSNLYIMVNQAQPKIQSFCALCDACDIVTSIENDNAVLFRKN